MWDSINAGVGAGGLDRSDRSDKTLKKGIGSRNGCGGWKLLDSHGTVTLGVVAGYCSTGIPLKMRSVAREGGDEGEGFSAFFEGVWWS